MLDNKSLSAPQARARKIEVRPDPRHPPLRIGIVDPPGVDEGTVPMTIVGLGFLAYPDGFELQRFRLMSDLLGWRFLVPQTHGYGPGPRLAPRYLRALASGDFSRLALAAEAAVSSATEITSPILLGYSMGASTIAAMARILAERGGRQRPSRVVLVEPVAARTIPLPRLALANFQEERWVEHHLALNEALPWTVPPADRQQDPDEPSASGALIDRAAMVRAMTCGGLRLDLVRAIRAAPGLQVDIVYGQHSRFVDTATISALDCLARTAGAHVRTIQVPGGRHAMWHALPLVADISRMLNEDPGIHSGVAT